MGEEVKITDYEERVTEWETGLPSAADLTPLSQPLIPPELASAFSISPEPYRTLLDVNRASRDTISALRGGSQAFSSNNFNDDRRQPTVVEADAEEEEDPDPDRDGSGSDSRKHRKIDCAEEADSALRTADNSTDQDHPSSARTVKRPRLVWTPQLHKRFVDVVAHLGIKNAVPKTIMQLMNVEGLTRENVASHLQKYRLYLKRMQGGLSNDAPSSSDQLFASTPVPQSLHDSAGTTASANSHHRLSVPVPMPFLRPPMMPMPVLGMPMPPHGHGHVGMPLPNHRHGFNPLHLQQRDWSANKYASVVSYPPPHTATPNDK